MRSVVLLFVFSVFCLSGITQVDPPELRCISVDANGDVTLSWIPPADPNGFFVEYEVYWSNAINGPYTPFTINGLASNTATHTTTANQNSFFYYVQSVYNDGTGNQNSISSDTLQSILPFFVNQNDSTAQIQWNPIHTPPLTSTAGSYTVFRKIGFGGTWNVLTTVPVGVEQLNDTFKVCSDSIYYRIEIDDNSGCTSTSAVLQDLFEDNTAPTVPIIDSVSVDPLTGDIIIGWNPSSSADTEGYLISYFDFASNAYIIIDTVYGINTTQYTDTSANGNFGVQQYGIAAFDTCYKGVPPTPNTSATGLEHRTMFLSTQSNFCEKEYRLSWTSYIGWDDLSEYRIYFNINGAPDSLLTVVDTADTSFVHQGVDPTKDYCYRIQGVNARGMTTSSNSVCIANTSTLTPDHFYITKASVVDNEFVEVVCYVDDSIPTQFYALERSIEEGGPYFEIQRQILLPGDTLLYFADNTAKVEQTSYYYRVVLYDTCGLPSAYSNVSRTIFVEGFYSDDSLSGQLFWNDYMGWGAANSGVQNYAVFRSIDGRYERPVEFLFDTLNILNFSTEEAINQGASLCYYIYANELPGNKYNIREVSISNEVCFTANPKIFIPNAFAPNGTGVNRAFWPIISYGSTFDYRLEIFNRYGNLVFSTTDRYQQWNGIIDGQTFADPGVYVYRLQFVNGAGDKIERIGRVTLLP